MINTLAWFALMGLPSLALTLGGVWVYRDAGGKWWRRGGVLLAVVGVVLLAFTTVVGLGFSDSTTGSPY